MSVVSGRLPTMYHPWRQLRHLEDWDLVWAPLPVDLLGVTDHHHQRIVLAEGQLQAQRRSTLAHELEHAKRGPAPRGAWWTAREERIVDQAAARKLIGIEQLGDALVWAHTIEEAAEELWVDVDTLQTRLDHLHPSERAYLKRRLETRQETT